MSNHNDVGYGKPPKKSQFKKGQSGNPKGRPKGVKSLRTVLRQELSTKVSLKEQGKTKRVTKLQALAKRLVTDALNGNQKAQSEVLRQINLHLSEPATDDIGEVPTRDQDLALLARYIAKQANKIGGKR